MEPSHPPIFLIEKISAVYTSVYIYVCDERTDHDSIHMRGTYSGD
jgi:hypothetical protein